MSESMSVHVFKFLLVENVLKHTLTALAITIASFHTKLLYMSLGIGTGRFLSRRGRVQDLQSSAPGAVGGKCDLHFFTCYIYLPLNMNTIENQYFTH